MGIAVTNSLYDGAVETSKLYLGPAGERFMRRQITTHLKIEPEKLSSKDLPELVSWVKITFALLTDNSKYVHEFADKLLALPSAGAKRAGGARDESFEEE